VTGLLLTAAVAAAVGYAAGRTRPGPRLLRWADRQVTAPAPPGPRLGCAVLVVLAALAAAWTLHPRRSAANVRAWRQTPARGPAPRLDPRWSHHRQESP
jgi:hypothetical protein